MGYVLLMTPDPLLDDALAAAVRAAGHVPIPGGDRQVTRRDGDVSEGSEPEELPPRADLALVHSGSAAQAAALEGRAGLSVEVLPSPLDSEAVEEILERHLGQNRKNQASASSLIGESRALDLVRRQIERIASVREATVLIEGPTGSGKELVAREVHTRTLEDPTSEGTAPFVALNCAALGEGLFESELFGHVAGAFTGASASGAEGLAAAAEGGTLFLDEIGELDLACQAKLLRFLQERSYRPVGSTADQRSTARVVAATNRDLAAAVAEGSFRADLYYRLNVLSIRVPGLAERVEDIMPITEYLLERVGSGLGQGVILTEEATSALREHGWPGNVRELEHTLTRACVAAEDGILRASHVREALTPDVRSTAPMSALEPSSSLLAGDTSEAGLVIDQFELRSVESRLIRFVLQRCGGNKSRAARELGIHRATLHNKLREYSIGA